MRIGIDCRIWGVRHGGIGRYTQELVQNLQELDKKNDYVLFCRATDFVNIPSRRNFRKVLADIKHYTFAEQLKLPGILARENLDLLHTPHFNVPVLYKGKFVTTIHDLTWHEIKGLGVTTLSAPAYYFKYIAYRSVVKKTVSRAVKIIVPSNTIKKDLIRRFSLQPEKVVVTYEGATFTKGENLKFKISNLKLLHKYNIQKPYILYVGSLYPHKNVEIVARALKTLAQPSPLLVIVSARNVFMKRFETYLKEIKADNLVQMVGYIPDKDLATLYKASQGYIFPSLSEGFGLPGLEAMAYGTPVIASDIPVLKEIYGEAAVYFNPRSEIDIAAKIRQIISGESLPKLLIRKGRERVKKFSWEKMAKETLAIYNSLQEN